jgi:leucyl aminopeptidase
MSGLTIEILNTDAEGRLILCDALTYAERFKPRCGDRRRHADRRLHHRAGPSQHRPVHAPTTSTTRWPPSCSPPASHRRHRLAHAARGIYQEQLKSNFADMANIGGPPGGSVTAACFLERFTRKYTWAHLDIAGTAWKSGAAKGATGRPVPLLTTFLLNQAR